MVWMDIRTYIATLQEVSVAEFSCSPIICVIQACFSGLCIGLAIWQDNKEVT